jgi:hypothetical protein
MWYFHISSGCLKLVHVPGICIYFMVHFQQYFSYIVVVSFIDGGNRSTWTKQQTCRKSLTNCITKCCIEFTSPLMVKQLDYLTTHTSLSPIWCGFAPGFVHYKKGCTRLAAASDKLYQLLAHGCSNAYY